MTTSSNFHFERARPKGILFLGVGLIGLSLTWCFAEDWFPRIMGTLIFGGFTVFGGTLAYYGGCYRSWFADGRIHWSFPGRLLGKNDSCAVADIVEFQRIDKSGSSDSDIRYQFLLRDGTKKHLALECIGDPEKLFRALRRENPAMLNVDVRE